MTAARERRLPVDRAFDARRIPALRLLLCVVVVLGAGAVLALRAAKLERDIERIAVRLDFQTMRTAVDAERIVRGIRGEPGSVAELVGSNPIALLQRPPANYVGENTDADPVEPGSWRFDVRRRELVYCMRDAHLARGEATADSLLRFKIGVRSSEDAASERAAGADVPRLFAIAAPRWLEGSDADASKKR